MADAEPMDFSDIRASKGMHTVIESGIDPGLDEVLTTLLMDIQKQEAASLFSFAFKGITRNPKKLLSILDHVLRHGGMFFTPNYLLSPSYLARRNPLLRPAHNMSEIAGQVANPDGLGKKHREALTAIRDSEIRSNETTI
jgi:hypothetical protein